MNKNLLVLSVAAAAALASTASAAVSSNIVGYVKLNLAAGYNLVVNPLNNTNPNGNKITTLFAGETLSVLRWNGTGFVSTDLFAGSVAGGEDVDIAPGQAVFVQTDAATTVTLVGEALTGTQTVSVGTGSSFVGSKIPLAGTATELGLVPTGPATVLTWDSGTQGYVSFDYFGGWLGGEPSFAVGQGFVVQSEEAFTWSKTFTP